MKKIVLVLMVLLMITSSLFSVPQEYTADEFPQWSLHLRRAETLFFGSLPLTFAITSLSYSLLTSFGVPEISSTDVGETLFLFSTAAALSLTIAVTDYYLGK